MARPYTRGSKQFVFRAGGDHRSVSVGDPQEAYEAFDAFFGDGTADTYVIEDRPASQSLMLLPGRGAIARVEGTGEARTEYLKVEGTNRYLPSTLLFFEDGCGGLDHYGQWFPELDDLDASPEARGAARAASFTTEAAAIEEVARIWADSGIVDPSDRYYVFFDSHDMDDDRAERAELLTLVEFLGLERVAAPAEAADGEIGVRTEPRLDVEFAMWS